MRLDFLRGVKLMRLDSGPLLFVEILMRELLQNWDRESVFAEMHEIRKREGFAEDMKQFMLLRLKKFISRQSGFPAERKDLLDRCIEILT
jgi:hypothetical protein